MAGLNPRLSRPEEFASESLARAKPAKADMSPCCLLVIAALNLGQSQAFPSEIPGRDFGGTQERAEPKPLVIPAPFVIPPAPVSAPAATAMPLAPDRWLFMKAAQGT